MGQVWFTFLGWWGEAVVLVLYELKYLSGKTRERLKTCAGALGKFSFVVYRKKITRNNGSRLDSQSAWPHRERRRISGIWGAVSVILKALHHICVPGSLAPVSSATAKSLQVLYTLDQSLGNCAFVNSGAHCHSQVRDRITTDWGKLFFSYVQ